MKRQGHRHASNADEHEAEGNQRGCIEALHQKPGRDRSRKIHAALGEHAQAELRGCQAGAVHQNEGEDGRQRVERADRSRHHETRQHEIGAAGKCEIGADQRCRLDAGNIALHGFTHAEMHDDDDGYACDQHQHEDRMPSGDFHRETAKRWGYRRPERQDDAHQVHDARRPFVGEKVTHDGA